MYWFISVLYRDDRFRLTIFLKVLLLRILSLGFQRKILTWIPGREKLAKICKKSKEKLVFSRQMLYIILR